MNAANLEADVVVVGAGVVGLAVAAELALTRSVLAIERHQSFGRETSSHNSGVIHSGIYYPTGSLKHRLCLEGNAALYAWCERYGVPHRRTGKLIVAISEAELDQLADLEARARANAVPGVEVLTAAEARNLEPAVPAVGALRSSTTGIVDAHALARSLQTIARERGALLAYQHEVIAGERTEPGFHLEVRDATGANTSVRCAAVVNAAGHGAPDLASALGYPLDGAEGVPALRQHVSRGRYFDVTTRAVGPVSHLIYPVPEPDLVGLGVHVTMDLEGMLHLGPDTTWLPHDADLDYRNDNEARAAFLASAQRLLPSLRDEDIAPGQVGYRPKLSGPGEPAADFLIWHDRGYVHLGGIESPGLTSSLPIAREVAALLQ